MVNFHLDTMETERHYCFNIDYDKFIERFYCLLRDKDFIVRDNGGIHVFPAHILNKSIIYNSKAEEE